MPRTTPAKTRAKVATTPPLDVDDVPASDVAVSDFFTPVEETLDYVKAILWGREGAGKTTAAARLINSQPEGHLLVINAEAGLKKIPLRKRGVELERVQVWPNVRAGQRITFGGLLELHKRLVADLAADPNSWAGVVFDSATEIYQVILDQVQRKRVVALKRKGLDPDVNHVDLADYGDMAKIFRDILRKFRDLPTHVVITALERRDVDTDTGKPVYGPAVSPALQLDLLGMMDFSLYLKTEDEEGPYRALTSKSSRYRVKDRYDVLPRVMAEPSMDRVMAYVNEELVEADDPLQAALPEPKPRGKKKTPSNDEADSD